MSFSLGSRIISDEKQKLTNSNFQEESSMDPTDWYFWFSIITFIFEGYGFTGIIFGFPNLVLILQSEGVWNESCILPQFSVKLNYPFQLGITKNGETFLLSKFIIFSLEFRFSLKLKKKFL